MQDRSMLHEKITPNYLSELRDRLKRGDNERIAEAVGTNRSYVAQVLGGNRGREVMSEKGLRIVAEAQRIIIGRNREIVERAVADSIRIWSYGEARVAQRA